MILKFFKKLLGPASWEDAQYAPFRAELRQAGLDEGELRRMDPDDRVAVLEQAHLDPYDYIYLACS